jgi:predicted RNA-binding Zn-ribbon protein involved in translation (DUF1610 family)
MAGGMSYPIKTCVICGEEFELKPDKPGFATHCPDCTESEATDSATKHRLDADDARVEREANAERRKAIRDLLYRKDS